MRKDIERKTKRLWIRMSAQDAELIKQKAANYKTVSGMIWDAIKQFDDTGTKRKIVALNEMIAFYKKYQQDLAWMGGNFNQVVKRANELAIANELTVPYFEKVLYPQIMELQRLLTALKQEQHQIAKRLTR
ncbi:hypothetical protein Prede_2415 [Prevotella dentalis DSM 3688]|uniref:Mobilization protein n=2 Tax=Prevotella dentalis (strain ATCC 49559 / DSM 3688 / JCM 13448 / NCTC 12043 / ES 2772) TaxID=908937 RepID=L0JDQ0_PREDD|nr:hypothetical protein Prede_2415 [Prevotella dentalis DSM 3688]